MVAIPFKLLNGQSFMVEVDPSFTILQVKQQVEVRAGSCVLQGARERSGADGPLSLHAGLQANHGVPVAKQTMIFAGKKLQDTATIVDLGIVSETGQWLGSVRALLPRYLQPPSPTCAVGMPTSPPAVMLVLPPGTNIRMGGPPRGAGGGSSAGGGKVEETAASLPPPVAAAAPVVATSVGETPTAVATPVATNAKAGAGRTAVATAAPVASRALGAAPPPPAPAAAAAPAAADGVVALNVKELSGTIRTVHVRLNQPFREIKLELQRLTRIPAAQQRLVFRGALVDDSQTPAFYNCNNDTCMHLVRHVVRGGVVVRVCCRVTVGRTGRLMVVPFFVCVQTRDVLSEVITKEGLQANCMYCHKAGAQFDARPLCANCL